MNFDHELEKINKFAVETYDYEVGYFPEEAGKSPLAKAIHLVRLAMQDVSSDDCTQEGADAWIKQYVDVELKDIELPEVVEEEDDE